MAATENVRQLSQSHNSSVSRQGVVTLIGYGIQVRVDRGHLLLQDGIGADRRFFRLPRVGHGLRRVVVVGTDGMVSLAALRWLADQDVAFSMLERDGKPIAVTGPVRPSDAKLRRAQALAHYSGVALRITRELISQKLAGQEQVARDRLLDSTTADVIAQFRAALPTSDNITTIRLIESQAARAYWSAWSTLPINFPKNQLRRVPEHWRSFGARVSPLTGSPRLAANPPNAILNYLYALLESEARLAAAALGLDPGMGVLHVDTTARDSLACDLMEVVRPQVDAYMLDWITRQPLNREWFFEQRDGNCRLMAPFAVQLSKTAPTWGRAVAPIAEWVAHAFWSTIPKPDRPLATHLTQTNKRKAKDALSVISAPRLVKPNTLCRGCGQNIAAGRANCAKCSIEGATERLAHAARLGRVAARTSRSFGETSRLSTSTFEGARVMGQNQTTTVADPKFVLAQNPATARRCFNVGHPIADWSFSLVCKPDSTRVSTSSEALARPGETGRGCPARRTLVVLWRNTDLLPLFLPTTILGDIQLAFCCFSFVFLDRLTRFLGAAVASLIQLLSSVKHAGSSPPGRIGLSTEHAGSSPPGQIGLSAEHAGGSPPGRIGLSTEHAGSSPPGQIGLSTEHAGSSPPGRIGLSTEHAGSSPPGQIGLSTEHAGSVRRASGFVRDGQP